VNFNEAAPSVLPEATADYTITLTNEGNGDLNGDIALTQPIIADYLPTGMSLAFTDANGNDAWDEGEENVTIETPASGNAGDASFHYAGNIASWSFAGFLAEGESIKVNVQVVLDQIVVTSSLTNEAYGTSAAALLPSKSYPTGASFVPGTGMGTENIVSAVSHPNDYSKLNSAAGLADKGLFVKATETIPVKRAGFVDQMKQIKVNDGAWHSGTAPLDVYPGDVISYKLLLSNGFPNGVAPVTNVVLADTLAQNGTQWTSALTAGWKWEAEPIVSLASRATPLVEGTDYALVLSPDEKTFTISLTGAQLVAGDVLTVEYQTTALPDKNALDAIRDGIGPDPYAQNAQKSAYNVGELQYVLGTQRVVFTKPVSARFIAPPVAIDGMVWEDKNYDGVNARNASEPGAGNVEVTLFRSTDDGATETQIGGAQTTAAAGTYSFTNLAASYNTGIKYQLRYSLSGSVYNGYQYTTHITGANNSDVNPVPAVGVLVGKTEWFALNYDGQDASDLTRDAGIYKLGTISGLAWFDANANGIQDDAEIAKGADVTLTYTGGYGVGTNETTTTDEYGQYSFTNQAKSGDFVITFDKGVDKSDPANNFHEDLDYRWAGNGLGDGTNDSDAIPATDVYGNIATSAGTIGYNETIQDIDAGIVPYFHITGFTWMDANNDGVRDDAEDIVANVKVRLLDGNGAGVANTVTDAEGSYTFDELLTVGNTTYTVEFANPDYKDFVFTRPGHDHTATNMKGSSASGGLVRDYKFARTDAVTLSGHSDAALNAGFANTPTYTVTYDPNGGSGAWGSGLKTITVKPGRLVPVQAVTLGGYFFNGWFENGASAPWDFIHTVMPKHNVYLKADWSAVSVPEIINVITRYLPGPVIAQVIGGVVDEIVNNTPISDGDVPQTTTLPDASTPRASNGAWSLLNLIVSIVALAISVIMVISAIRRKDDDRERDDAGNLLDGEPEEFKVRLRRNMIITAIIGIVPLILFLILENTTLPRVWIDKYSLLFGIVFLVQIVFLVIQGVVKKKVM
jgi:uncharacterized repeat protein (TIGR02543 family)